MILTFVTYFLTLYFVIALLTKMVRVIAFQETEESKGELLFRFILMLLLSFLWAYKENQGF